jgi:hypothetical protein
VILDLIGTVAGREVTLWRDHLPAMLMRTLSDGRVMTMAPAVSLVGGGLPG